MTTGFFCFVLIVLKINDMKLIEMKFLTSNFLPKALSFKKSTMRFKFCRRDLIETRRAKNEINFLVTSSSFR